MSGVGFEEPTEESTKGRAVIGICYTQGTPPAGLYVNQPCKTCSLSLLHESSFHSISGITQQRSEVRREKNSEGSLPHWWSASWIQTQAEEESLSRGEFALAGAELFFFLNWGKIGIQYDISFRCTLLSLHICILYKWSSAKVQSPSNTI